MKLLKSLLGGLLFATLLFSCKKQETVIVDDNNSPYYDEVATTIVENYVNRMYIDLIGREPLDVEMEADVAALRRTHLSFDTRDSLMRILQFNADTANGDSSYKFFYYHRFYEMSKVRLLEGASNGQFSQRVGIARFGAIVDSLQGDSLGWALNNQTAEKLQRVLDSEREYFNGEIGVAEMYARMIDNSIYDQINMNTFNFINATFNDLLLRFPTSEEFNQAFDMIEYNVSGILFGQSGQNKGDYIGILTHARGFYEGMIRSVFLSVMAREPSTVELESLMREFWVDRDFQKVQRKIMVTDEYARF